MPPPLQTVDVQAKFVNGKPDKIEVKYVMRRWVLHCTHSATSCYTHFRTEPACCLLVKAMRAHLPCFLHLLCTLPNNQRARVRVPTCVLCSSFEWDRFMRFMERYAEDKGLGFQKS